MAEAEQLPKRRREKYSKLICLGCRARRIRCVLPDISIQPSAEPQPAEKACQRCQQNGLDCIVDFTTLGRPAQKRNRIDHANSDQQQTNNASTDPVEDFEESVSRDFRGFILAQPDGDGDEAENTEPQIQQRSKNEVAESLTSVFSLLATLLSRDKIFASSIGPQPSTNQSVLDLVDQDVAGLLDSHLVWHKLYHPDLPSLPTLRREIKSMDERESERTSCVYLFTLLCDLALDVPSPRLASVRYLQPTLKALTYRYGQELLFTLSRSRYTVLALSTTAEYRPLALTSSPAAAVAALKTRTYGIMGKYVASELGYAKAGSHLTQAINDANGDPSHITTLMNQCLHWIWLNIAEDLQGGIFNDWVRRMEPTALECLEALHTAVLLSQMPSEIILAYCSVSYWTQMLANVRDMTEHWKDLKHLEEVIQGHKVFCDREKEVLDRLLEQQDVSSELSSIISHLAEMERHLSHVIVVGTALLFAVMCGAFAQAHDGAIQAEQAAQVSDTLINQLLAHKEDDATRPSYRRFLEQYGATRQDELQQFLANFITAADTLKIDGIPYIGPTRDSVGWVIAICRDLVEGEAARLKGWGGLSDRVDVQMILFHECARRLESMSANAGSEDALATGCLLTAAAKLVRGLHRILQGFKKTAAATQRRSASGSTKSDPTPPEVETDMPGLSESATTTSQGWETVLSDELFSDWENWPQFDPSEFVSDAFGNPLDFDITGF